MTRLAFLLSLAAASLLVFPSPAPAAEYSSERWEKDIQAFEAADKKQMPPEGIVLFTGASGIKRWGTLAQNFPQHKVLNRGFGGSQMVDLVYYCDRIILPYKPKMILIQTGGNDINSGKSPEQVFADFKTLIEKIRAKLPEVKIAYVSLSPSPARWAQRDKQQEANKLIKGYIDAGKNLVFIDTWSVMLGTDGMPKPEYFVADRLHYTDEGYKARAEIIRPLLP